MENPTSRIEHKITWLVVGLAVIGLIMIGYRVLGGDLQKRIPVSVGAKTFYADVARTDEERSLGLGGTEGLDDSQALLMVFDTEDRWKIWMKDMNYPIDIVWINDDKKVVDTVQRARPESYPDKLYVPRNSARYVLELPEGSVQRYSIAGGASVRFEVSGVR